jgi:hypothetical protein
MAHDTRAGNGGGAKSTSQGGSEQGDHRDRKELCGELGHSRQGTRAPFAVSSSRGMMFMSSLYMLLRAEIYGAPGGQRSVGQGRESHHLLQHPFSALNQQRPAAGTSSPPPTHSLPIQSSVVAFAYVFAFDALRSLLLKDLMLVDETTKVTPSGKSFADVWLSTVRRVHWRALQPLFPPEARKKTR